MQSQLNKHLLRTVGSDIANLLFNATATDQMLSLSEETSVTPEVCLCVCVCVCVCVCTLELCPFAQ